MKAEIKLSPEEEGQIRDYAVRLANNSVDPKDRTKLILDVILDRLNLTEENALKIAQEKRNKEIQKTTEEIIKTEKTKLLEQKGRDALCKKFFYELLLPEYEGVLVDWDQPITNRQLPDRPFTVREIMALFRQQHDIKEGYDFWEGDEEKTKRKIANECLGKTDSFRISIVTERGTSRGGSPTEKWVDLKFYFTYRLRKV